MASNNENNLHLISCNDKSTSKKHLNEHEETIKKDQMASKKSLSNDGEEQIANMGENDLKNLLEEALTYKNPRDANLKSETFKRLLQNVTEEEEHKRKFESNSLHWKAQSNSLQNLLDESHLQNHQSQISSKKQRRKNSTSVSTRRQEGGSLPVDMHHSSTLQSPSDQPQFLSEYKNSKKRKEKQQYGKDTVIDMIDADNDDRKSFHRYFDSNKDTSSMYSETDIEMKNFASRVEMEVQDHQSSSSKFTTANSTPNTTVASHMTGNPIPTTTLTNQVDTPIQFSLENAKSYQQSQNIEFVQSTINHNNNIVLTGGGSSSDYGSIGFKVGGGSLPLPSGAGVQSVIDPKSFSYQKYKPGQVRDDATSLIQTTPSILPTTHSSSSITTTTSVTTTTTANSKDSKALKKRTAKSERNEKEINVSTIEGYRGNESLETLLTYIDGQQNNSNADSKGQKNHPKNGIVSSNNNSNNLGSNIKSNEQLLNADDKKKKMVSKNKEKMNKLKKSNSMDELCSKTRQQETTASNKTIVQDVTLRSKNNASSNVAKKDKIENNGNNINNNKNEKWQAKRNERRSWGTEGLWPEPANDTITSNEEVESNSSSSSGVQLDFRTQPAAHQAITTATVESINTSSETDKFQVVIKKKKVKRKSSDNADVKPVTSQYVANRRDGSGRTGTKSSINNENRNDNRNNNNNKTNNSTKQMNHDAKQNSIGSKNRRKSTSSMPPSDDDGEYSDGGDSVQSLPIETTKTTSSLLSAPNNNNNNNVNNISNSNNHSSAESSGKTMIRSNNKNASNPTTQISPSQQQQQISSNSQKPTTFSYADIAKTNTNRTNNNSNNNNVMPASTEKMWPSISSSSTHQNNTNNNNNVIIINSSSNSNDPFAVATVDAINNNNNNNNPPANQQTPSLNNTMSFPDLVVENSKNKDITTNGDATQTEKSLNGLERAFDNNNNPSSTLDRLNNNQKISYSQSLLEYDANGNNGAKVELTNSNKNTLTKSKSVDHNNLSSIEHYPALEKTKQTLSDVLSKPIESLKMVKVKTVPGTIKVGTIEVIDTGKKKKDKLGTKKTTATVATTTSTYSSTNSSNNNNIHNNNNISNHTRPAVIIMNDCIEKLSDPVELGITFGFDINEHLLAGNQMNGDAIAAADHSVEMNATDNNNIKNNNCDIINTNLSSNNNNNNLINQPCVFEIYENFISSPPQSVIDHSQQMMQHMQSSPKLMNNSSLIKDATLLDSSNDLGYMSSSLITNSPANQKITNNEICNKPTQPPTSDNNNQQYDSEFNHYPKPMDIKQHMKLDELIARFVSPEPAKNFNYDELVTFVSEEWTKVERNGVIFNGQ